LFTGLPRRTLLGNLVNRGSLLDCFYHNFTEGLFPTPEIPAMVVRGMERRAKEVVKKAMYAAVRRYEGVTDTKEVAQQMEEHFLPMISEMPGFVAYYWVDAGEGVVVTTSVFEHQAAEEESSWKAGQFVAQYIAPLTPNPPQITAGEVVAHKAS
jgi:hypothetical protein